MGDFKPIGLLDFQSRNGPQDSAFNNFSQNSGVLPFKQSLNSFNQNSEIEKRTDALHVHRWEFNILREFKENNYGI